MDVAADFAEGVDAENLGAAAGGGFHMMTALGLELMPGEPIMLTVEYEGGAVVITSLELGAVLVMPAGTGVNLGRVRLAACHFPSQYMQHAAVAA